MNRFAPRGLAAGSRRPAGLNLAVQEVRLPQKFVDPIKREAHPLKPTPPWITPDASPTRAAAHPASPVASPAREDAGPLQQDRRPLKEGRRPPQQDYRPMQEDVHSTQEDRCPTQLDAYPTREDERPIKEGLPPKLLLGKEIGDLTGIGVWV